MRINAHAIGSISMGCAIAPIAPVAANAEKARECPTVPIKRGAHQQPTKNPRKCDEPSNPISVFVKPSAAPDRTSSGPIAPELSCKSEIDAKSAMNEMIIRMPQA